MKTITRRTSAERREQIGEAALRIIGERGVTSLTMATLAEAVGVTSGALFRHFESRQEILEHAVRHAAGKVERTFPDGSLPPLERILQLARARVDLLTSDPGLGWLLRADQAHLILPDRAVERLRDLVDRSKRYLLEALREGVRQGSIRGDIEPQVLLVPVMGTIHVLVGMSGVHRLAEGGRRPDPAPALAALKRLLAPPDGDGAGGSGGRGRDRTNEV